MSKCIVDVLVMHLWCSVDAHFIQIWCTVMHLFAALLRPKCHQKRLRQQSMDLASSKSTPRKVTSGSVLKEEITSTSSAAPLAGLLMCAVLLYSMLSLVRARMSSWASGHHSWHNLLGEMCPRHWGRSVTWLLSPSWHRTRIWEKVGMQWSYLCFDVLPMGGLHIFAFLSFLYVLVIMWNTYT